jgi:hypothetical protein
MDPNELMAHIEIRQALVRYCRGENDLSHTLFPVQKIPE